MILPFKLLNQPNLQVLLIITQSLFIIPDSSFCSELVGGAVRDKVQPKKEEKVEPGCDDVNEEEEEYDEDADEEPSTAHLLRQFSAGGEEPGFFDV
jgi:hypothetical protein